MRRHSGITNWVQVGDLGGRSTSYEGFPTPLSFISGNHENWNEIKEIDNCKGPENLIHLKNGSMATICGLTILSLGGNYSSKYFNYLEKDLHQDRRRHFVKEQCEELLNLSKTNSIDILLTHEAPTPYIKPWYDVDRDMGIPAVTELIRGIKPKFHFFGHHHSMTINKIGSTLSVGLGRFNDEIFIVGPESPEISYISKEKMIINLPLTNPYMGAKERTWP